MTDGDMDVHVIAAKVDAGFSLMREKFADTHDRLERIEDQVRETNGRVTRHDEKIGANIRRIDKHDELIDALAKSAGFTRLDAQWWGLVIIGTVGATVGVLRFLGKI